MPDELPQHQIFKSLFDNKGRGPLTGAAEGDASTKSRVEQIVTGMPDAVVFDGYYVGLISYNEQEWHVLYTDRSLQNWILIDKNAACGFQEGKTPDSTDTIWVRRHGSVCRGSGARGVELLFLTGTLTTAGELSQSLAGRGARRGLFEPESPPFCTCGHSTYS
jgi:hypothetical protein